jgi:hypothetical protein
VLGDFQQSGRLDLAVVASGDSVIRWTALTPAHSDPRITMGAVRPGFPGDSWRGTGFDRRPPP